jgi:hypothetical protein
MTLHASIEKCYNGSYVLGFPSSPLMPLSLTTTQEAVGSPEKHKRSGGSRSVSAHVQSLLLCDLSIKHTKFLISIESESDNFGVVVQSGDLGDLKINKVLRVKRLFLFSLCLLQNATIRVSINGKDI